MSNEMLMYGIFGAVFGYFLGLVNAFFRKVIALWLIQTEKRKAVTFVSLFSLLRLALIAFIIYGLSLAFKNTAVIIGTLAGLVLHSIVTTFSYIVKKKEIKGDKKV